MSGSWRTIPIRYASQEGLGGIAFIEGVKDVPFDIKRVYYLFDIPEGVIRGAHAHRELEQCIIAVRGSLTLSLDNGTRKETIRLTNPKEGVLLSPMVWRELYDFSPDASCIVLASRPYDESDYIRDYAAFKAACGVYGI